MANNWITDMSQDFQRVRSVNATNTSLPAKAATRTEPLGDAATATGASVIDLRSVPGEMPTRLKLIPYGTGDADDVFVIRVLGWGCVRKGQADETWFAVTLAELTCTMSAYTGVALGAVVATEFFCDTIVGVTNKFNEDVSIDISSPADDTPAMAVLDLKGFRKIEIVFDTTTGDPSGCNCLWASL